MPQQRYVSDVLTHFVGAGRSPEEQYDILVTILRSGVLGRLESWRLGLTTLVTQEDAEFSQNQMFNAAIVCFCDIPFGDFEIHMQKYSRFGISFAKSFLIARGANPVFYIAQHAGVRDLRTAGLPGVDREDLRYSRLVDENFHLVERQIHDQIRIRELFSMFHDEIQRLQDLPLEQFTPAVQEQLERLDRVQRWLELYFFSFAKVFDDTLDEADPDNYYMEREWRTLHPVYFQLDDVRSVILPEDRLGTFRRDFPNYNGSLIAAERLS